MSTGLSGDLLLIRHGQTRCTLEGRFCGDHDAKLSPVGERMAAYTAEHPSLATADLLLSSPATRALSTAEPISTRTGLPITIDDRLRELSFGAWENRHPTEVANTPEHRAWTTDPTLFPPPHGESALSVLTRTTAAIRDALTTAKRVAVVTHKAPIRLLMAYLLDMPLSRYRNLATVPVASLTHLHLHNGRTTLHTTGDLTHLPPNWRPNPDHAT